MLTFMFDSTVVLYLLHMAHPHVECTHTHSRGAVQGIMRMRTPSIRCKVVLTGEQNTNSAFFFKTTLQKDRSSLHML